MKRCAVIGAVSLCLGVLGCGSDGSPEQGAKAPSAGHGDAPAPTNRVDIPAAVRQNLGITFAKVEQRNVAQTLRVPGRFELLPTARREYRSPMAGRVELLVKQYDRVDAGTPLYRLDAAGWRELHEEIAAAQAKVNSMPPLRDAHRVHEKSLADKVRLWEERLAQLEELRAAGGGSASEFTEARATLNATQAELADVMERDAELQAEQLSLEATLRALQSKREMMTKAMNRPSGHVGTAETSYEVVAIAPGVVETLNVMSGGLAEESGMVLAVVQPDQLRFRARALQSDIGRLRDGLPTRIAPPQGEGIGFEETMTGAVQLGIIADADERTIDLVVQPERLAAWARAGVSAHLEVTLAGGSEELAIPLSAVVRDGSKPIIFRRDPANPDKAIRMEADTGLSDGRWIVLNSGVKEGDEIVLDGNYQLMLATSGSAPKGGHFHSDGTFHEGED